MATADSPISSDEECEIVEGFGTENIPQGYAFEPTRPAARRESDSDSWTSTSEEDSIDESDEPANRLEDVGAWCSCDRCETTTLLDEKEAICCHSIGNCLKRMSEGGFNSQLSF